jgi:hypothetical protein
MVSNVTFSDSATAVYSERELTSLSWLGNNVVTLITDQNPVTVISTFDLVQSLNGCTIKTPINDEVVVKIKVDSHLEVKKAEVFFLKSLVKRCFQQTDTTASPTLDTKISRSPVFNIVGLNKRIHQDCDDAEPEGSLSSELLKSTSTNMSTASSSSHTELQQPAKKSARK